MQPDDDKTQAVTVLAKGTVIGHYRIVEKIGAGGPSEVQVNWTENITLSLLAVRPLLEQDETMFLLTVGQQQLA